MNFIAERETEEEENAESYAASIKIEYNLIFMCQMCIRFEELAGFGCEGVWSTALVLLCSRMNSKIITHRNGHDENSSK